MGLVGQVGSGANAILRVLAGLAPLYRGSITLNGRPFAPRSIRDSIGAGVAFCSDDRKRDGIFAIRNLVENLSAPAMERISRFGVMDRRSEAAHTRAIAQQFDIDINGLDRLAGNLSGGNQQKVALGKWLGIGPSLVLVEEPTRGVDVGARAEIYRHLRAQTARGLGVLFVSSDTYEVLGLADRVGTFFHGALVQFASADAMTAESVTRDVTHPAVAA